MLGRLHYCVFTVIFHCDHQDEPFKIFEIYRAIAAAKEIELCGLDD
jgi:hypothetical protein